MPTLQEGPADPGSPGLQPGSEAGRGPAQPRPAWLARLPLLIAIVLPLVFLLPFVNKAYHIDDTVFIWVGRQILHHPLDFFGFSQNWSGTEQTMTQINKNPPGVSFYLAAVTALVGEREILVHLAFLPIAVAISLGTYLLGRQIGLRPAMAAIAATCCVLTPAYLVSCGNVMSDPLMVAWFVWAVYLWMRGTETKRFALLALSGACIACSVVSKYFGICAVPLLLAYAICRDRRPSVQWLALLIPVVVLALYQWWTNHLYGTGLFFDAAAYAQQTREKGGLSLVAGSLVGLSFAGGSMIVALCYAPVVWSWRGMAAGLGLAGLVALLVCGIALPPSYPLRAAGAIRVGFLLQWVIFVIAGVSICALALDGFWKRRDPASVLLLCWIGGTLLFSVTANWTINARSVFPMAPAVGLLVARQLESLLVRKPATRRWRFVVPLIPAACLALGAAWADYAWANSARNAAYEVQSMQKGRPGKLWYAGHWGFQYYMERVGGMPIDYKKPQVVPGDLLVFPLNNSCVYELRREYLTPVRVLEPRPCSWMSTMMAPVGAGFYTSLWGPLPYVFAHVPYDSYPVYLFGKQ